MLLFSLSFFILEKWFNHLHEIAYYHGSPQVNPYIPEEISLEPHNQQ
jgi:hypothetical protein